MESKGIGKSSSGLELTIATPAPGTILNFSSGSNGGNGSSNGNARELALLDTINHPAHGGEERNMQMVGVDVEGDGVGGSSSQPRKYVRLSQEQMDQLEATFQQNNIPVS